MISVGCSVCGSCRSCTFLEEGMWHVVSCNNCGHLYTQKLNDAGDYVAKYQKAGNWIKAESVSDDCDSAYRFESYANEVERLLEPAARVLEIGCSKGFLLKQLQGRGFDCYGVEPGQDAIIARDLLGQERVYHEYYSAPLPLQVDIVTMWEVLEHIPEPDNVVETVFRQLSQGGYFMGSVPNGSFIRLKVLPKRMLGIKSMIVPLIMDAGNHINYFDSYGLGQMLRRLGFEVLWIKNAPLDFNYVANRYSPVIKRAWWQLARLVQSISGKLIGSNIMFLAQKQ